MIDIPAEVWCKEFENFAHVTSHELRDPVRNILQECEALEAMSPDVKKNVEAMTKYANNLLHKIDALRQYSYLFHDMNIETVDCNIVLEAVKSSLSDIIAKKKAKIEVHDQLPTIQAEPKHIEKALHEIIANALYFNESDVPVIEIGVSRKDDIWIFSIKDNGIGLDMLYKDVAFMLAQSIEESTDREALGVGLSFAKRIAENHGGGVWFESEEGEGATFYFSCSAT